MNIPVTIISMLLFFVLFFGIGFLVNMLLRMSWGVAIAYLPIISIFFVGKVRFFEYFTNSKAAFLDLGHRYSTLGTADVLILSSGLAGAIGAGITIKLLRKNGYQMF
ncbi:MAG: YuiB family protein [Bacillota bacterium]|nr:YuiB family protein [Bacillota bacterium]